MMFTLSIAAAVPLATCALAYQPCSTRTVSASVPTTAVALNSYSYCGGTLNTSAYVKNLDYNKVVNLYYTNQDNQATPLNVVQLQYSSSVPETNYEIWTSTTPEVNLDGIQQLLNITYQATDLSQTFVQLLNDKVVASGPPATTSVPPAPFASPTGFSKDITHWLRIVKGMQGPLNKALMFNNIEVTNAVPGSVVAAQSYANPDYGYSWVRDSSLTMDVVATLYGAATNATVKEFYEALFFRYAKSRAAEQHDPNLITGDGEPKSNLDGSAFTLPWGRPQNDGPATAAVTLMEFSDVFLQRGGSKSTILNSIYNSTHNTSAPILHDLLFVARNWSSPSFDLWEEEESNHFYTRMVQRRAMVQGAAFATSLGDSQNAKLFAAAARDITASLNVFYSSIRNLVLYSYGPVLHGKTSFKDVSVLLGIIHGYANDGFYSFSDDRILATAWQLATSFIPVYPISAKHKDSRGRTLGTPIGRYPEDVYNGTSTGLGNPWYLCTAAMAETFFRASSELTTHGQISVTNISLPFWQYFAPEIKTAVDTTYGSGTSQFTGMIASLHGWGDAFLRTIKYYTPEGGHLSEEIDRSTGVPVGAIDLTWSFAALQTAAFARAQAIGNERYVRNLANLPVATNSSHLA